MHIDGMGRKVLWMNPANLWQGFYTEVVQIECD
jgi:hypothetical protein